MMLIRGAFSAAKVSIGPLPHIFRKVSAEAVAISIRDPEPLQFVGRRPAAHSRFGQVWIDGWGNFAGTAGPVRRCHLIPGHLQQILVERESMAIGFHRQLRGEFARQFQSDLHVAHLFSMLLPWSSAC